MILGSGVLGSKAAQLGARYALNLLPDNIIVATQSVHDIRRQQFVIERQRTVTVVQPKRTVTFDG